MSEKRSYEKNGPSYEQTRVYSDYPRGNICNKINRFRKSRQEYKHSEK